MKTIYLAGGCFWGIQKYMDQFDELLKQSSAMPMDI
nr:peptide-methionine (S)-S-oxide reductase [Traorella massiliensis]